MPPFSRRLIPSIRSKTAGSRATVVVTGGIRCCRTTDGIRICTTAKTASVTAIAGTVRRTTIPTIVPSTNANSPYAIGTMLRASKLDAANRSANT